MDMRMPVMDGYEATQRIKTMAKGQDTVIIALTASAFEEDRARILSAGCDDFLRKPAREDDIFRALAKHLGVRFVYDAEPALAAAAGTADDDPSPAGTLASLPANWVAEMKEATTKADRSLADALADLAEDFEYGRIRTWMEKAGG
jgi:DNA-binding NarL/FixJ family response regulator